jgi:DNA polymerase-3 subunit epsilon
MKRKTSNLLVIDIETTGPNPFLHDPLSVALVPVQGRTAPAEINVRIDNPAWTSYGLRNFKAFEDDWKRSALNPGDAVHEIESYLGRVSPREEAVLVGHNVGFDMSFLRKLAYLAGQEAIKGLCHRTLDTYTLLYLALSRGLVPQSALSSDGAFEFFAIRVPSERRHTALGDALATRELFAKLLKLPLRADGTTADSRWDVVSGDAVRDGE